MAHSQTRCRTATWGLLIFDKQTNDAPVCPGCMLCLLLIGNPLHQDGGANASPKIHHTHFENCEVCIQLIARRYHPVACFRGFISIGSEWAGTVHLDEKLGGHNWYQGLAYKTWTTIINNSRASVIKSYTSKIFIGQLGTLNNLQNTGVHPPSSRCVFLLFIPWLICVSLLSPCGTSEQHEVKAGHLLTSVISQKLRDVQPRCVPSNHSSEPSTKENFLLQLPSLQHWTNKCFPVKTQILVWD